MEWQLPETITFGFVMFSVVMLLYRWLGQQMGLQKQTNELLAQSMKGFTGLEKALDKHTDGFDDMIKVVSASFQAILTRVELSETNSLNVFQAFSDSVRKDHAFALGAIQAIPSVIEPAIKELTAQHTANTESNKGMQRIMEGVAKSQSKTNGEILKALQEIKATLDDIKREFPERIEKVEKDVDALRADIVKRDDPPEFIAPIEINTSNTVGIPIIGAVKSAEIGIETNLEKKDKPND